MFKGKLLHKLFLAAISLYFIITIPLILFFYYSDIAEGHKMGFKSFGEFISKKYDALLTHLVYAFFLAFIIALFSIRGVLKSIKNLENGVTRLRRGDLGASLPVYSNDELGDVTEAFNEMSATLKEYTDEMSKKDLYINTMFDPLWAVAMDDIVIDVNPAFTKLLGYEREEAIGKCLYEFFDSKNHRIMQDHIKLIEKGLSCTHEILIKNIHGVNIPTLLSGAPIIKNGRLVGKVGVFKDFREQKAFREGMANTIFNSIPDGVYTVDTEGAITAINNSAADILKVHKTGVIGIPCSKVISHTDEEGNLLCELSCPMTLAMRENTTVRMEAFVTVGEKTVPVLLIASPLIEIGGRAVGAVQVFRDISREKEIERMRTDFVESVSHEFRTPLSAIIGMTEMFLDNDVEEPQITEYLKTIHSEGVRLSQMVSQLLSISAIEHRKVRLEMKRMDLTEVINSCIKSYATEKIVKDKNANINLIPGKEYFSFVGDENRIKELITNLIENALFYSDGGVNILISLQHMDDNIVISIKDTGWGIPPEDLPHIFKRFYRGRQGRTVKGTGLGLSLCEEIVKLHGGIITVESKMGKGSEFRINLPLREKE